VVLWKGSGFPCPLSLAHAWSVHWWFDLAQFLLRWFDLNKKNWSLVFFEHSISGVFEKNCNVNENKHVVCYWACIVDFDRERSILSGDYSAELSR
jgi:hypothetical protein